MITLEQIKTAIEATRISREDAANEEKFPSGSHVQSVFEDGELCSEKAGRLLGQRTLHCFESGVMSNKRSVPLELFSERCGRNNEHGFVYCKGESASSLAKMIREYLRQD